MSERRHGHLLPLASTCMSTSLLPSVIYDFWCTCVFLRWRPPVWWSYILFCCVKVVEVPWFQRKIFPLPAWAPVWFQVCFIISDVRAFFLGGVLLWGGAKFYWAASRSTRGSSMAVEKHFPRTCMRISLFSSVFYDFWCSCVSFLGGVLLCGGVKCDWGASSRHAQLLPGTRKTFHPYLHEDQSYFLCLFFIIFSGIISQWP